MDIFSLNSRVLTKETALTFQKLPKVSSSMGTWLLHFPSKVIIFRCKMRKISSASTFLWKLSAVLIKFVKIYGETWFQRLWNWIFLLSKRMRCYYTSFYYFLFWSLSGLFRRLKEVHLCLENVFTFSSADRSWWGKKQYEKKRKSKSPGAAFDRYVHPIHHHKS